MGELGGDARVGDCAGAQRDGGAVVGEGGAIKEDGKGSARTFGKTLLVLSWVTVRMLSVTSFVFIRVS